MPAAEVNQVKDTPGDPEIMVIAPRFPSINQPWMDTYLEQLQKHGIEFRIGTALRQVGPYQQKVDELGLRDKTVQLKLGLRSSALSWLQHMLAHPVITTRALWQATIDQPREETLRNRLALAARSVRALRILDGFPRLKLIHSHSLAIGQHFITPANLKGLPLVLTFHGLEPPGVPQVAAHRRKRLFDAAKKVIVNTDFARQHVIELGCPPHKVTVLPQGLPTDDFPFIAREAPKARDKLELVSVGRLQRDKGQAHSILALKRLRDAGINATWHFVGAGPDRPRLSRLAKRLNIEESLSFHEGVSSADLLALYHRCHLFVLASRDSKGRVEHVETQGVVLQEAQATGCIPIATRVGGIPECINHGIDGFLVRDGSHRAIATAVMDLVSRPDDWPELQRNARRNVEERFSASTIGKRMAGLLRATMQEHRNNS